MNISIFGKKFSLVTLILIVVAFWLLWGHVLCSCSTISAKEAFKALLSKKEGFINANSMQGDLFANANMKPISTTTWFTPNLSYKSGQDISKDKGIQNILNRPKQPIPLPEGELDLFATTEFKPECCPNAYSNSTGCACMTMPQYTYLIERGSNNVPYSEY